ncbi:hypothetical protein O3G_MSEX014969 [Manduca sexta]|uniref:Uncharacterized protein n=1 Tax=Manduca sexta TaxID=7130 RepID=A0A922D0E7_MANSE|nr:hypothetical protein O3G_MSEX014969 [Manduca sexta]
MRESTAGHRPVPSYTTELALRLYASSRCRPSCVSRPAIWPEGVPHYVCQDAVSTPKKTHKAR